jgi:hypothetical protein
MHKGDHFSADGMAAPKDACFVLFSRVRFPGFLAIIAAFIFSGGAVALMVFQAVPSYFVRREKRLILRYYIYIFHIPLRKKSGIDSNLRLDLPPVLRFFRNKIKGVIKPISPNIWGEAKKFS